MAEQNQNLTQEKGEPGGVVPSPMSFYSSSKTYTVESLDLNPDLRFPHSVQWYEQMRRTDDQISGILKAMQHPVLGANWELVGNGVSPEVMEFVRTNIGLVDAAEARRRNRREGIVFKEHLRQALTCLAFGFSVFEITYNWNAETQKHHLRKLGHRPVTTLREIRVERDGGLLGVVQNPPADAIWSGGMLMGTFIPVDKLVWYTVEKEGADWTGTSVLRSAFRAWKYRTSLELKEAQSLERGGMGVPVIKINGQPSDQDRRMADEIVRNVRVGEQAGVVIPHEWDFDMKGTTGSTKDFGPTIDRYNQQISKSMMAMFMDLGHDAGARSLGDTMVDQFLDSCQGIADMLADTFTEHVIRDLVEINFPGQSYPVLVPGELKRDRDLDLGVIGKALQDGVLTKTRALEDRARAQVRLPKLADDEVLEAPAAPVAAVPASGVPPVPLQFSGADSGDHVVLDRMDKLTDSLRYVAELQNPRKDA